MTNNKIKTIINLNKKIFNNNNRINQIMIRKQDRKKIKIKIKNNKINKNNNNNKNKNSNNSNKKNMQKNRQNNNNNNRIKIMIPMTRMLKINKMMIKIIINKKIWQASNIMMSRPKRISSKINKKKNNS